MSIIEDVKKNTDVPVVVANNHSVIMWVNRKFEEVFQWSQKEIVGKLLTTIIPQELHDAHNLGFSRFIATEKSLILNQTISLKAVKKNGEVFAAEHYIQAEKNAEGVWMFAATICPVEVST